MSERKTKRLSGAFYRHQKKRKTVEREELRGALKKFRIPQKNTATQSTSSSAEPTVEQEGKTVNDKDTSSSSENENDVPEVLEDIAESRDFDFADAGTWPRLLSNSNIQMLVEMGPTQI